MPSLYLVSLLLGLPLLDASSVVDQVGKESEAILNNAIIKGEKVRQCSCEEQEACAQEMTKQAEDCISPCWSQFGEITEKPNELRMCFQKKNDLLKHFLTCFVHNIESCTETKDGPMIQKTNITELFRLVHVSISTKQHTIVDSLMAPIQKIVDTARTFAVCVKECFLEKNKDGFCFDRFGCQPLVIERKTRQTLRRCSRSINWRKEAGELCDCSVNAGLSMLRDYCSIVRAIAQRRNRRPNRP